MRLGNKVARSEFVDVQPLAFAAETLQIAAQRKLSAPERCLSRSRDDFRDPNLLVERTTVSSVRLHICSTFIPFSPLGVDEKMEIKLLLNIKKSKSLKIRTPGRGAILKKGGG